MLGLQSSSPGVSYRNPCYNSGRESFYAVRGGIRAVASQRRDFPEAKPLWTRGGPRGGASTVVTGANKLRGEHAVLRDDGNPYSGGYAALLQDGSDYSWRFGMLTFFQYARNHAIVPWPSMVGSFAYAAVVALLYSCYGLALQPIMSLSAIQQFLAAPLGFLLSFRVNQAYNRWWECRLAIGRVVQGASELGSIAACSSMKEKDLEYILTCLKGLLRAACHSLHSRMPQSDKNRELSDVLDEETNSFLSKTAVSGLTTNFDSLLFLIRCEIVKRMPSKDHALYSYPVMQNVADVQGFMGTCTSVFITPPPLSYTIHLRLLLSLYIASMPFYLCTTISPLLVPPVTAVAAFAFFGLDALSTAVSGPFGQQSEDLPVGDYVHVGISKLDRLRSLRDNIPSLAS